jgi:hypothetical protein
MSVEKTLRHLHYVMLRNGLHLYWPYSRTTLCGRDKVWALRVYWVTEPVCRDCMAFVGDIALAAATTRRGVRVA